MKKPEDFKPDDLVRIRMGTTSKEGKVLEVIGDFILIELPPPKPDALPSRVKRRYTLVEKLS